jgi:hypothetical protein
MATILIVDDDPTLVEFLKLLLDSEGYECFEAYDGKMALEQIRKIKPELVLLDYMMPNMHGLDVLKNVSKNFESSFVIMLTGKGSEEVAVECMKAGAADYVMKPFDNENLLAIVRNVLRLRTSEMEKQRLNVELQDVNDRLQKHVAELERMLEAWTSKKVEIDHLLTHASALLEGGASHGELASLLTEIRKKL